MFLGKEGKTRRERRICFHVTRNEESAEFANEGKNVVSIGPLEKN